MPALATPLTKRKPLTIGNAMGDAFIGNSPQSNFFGDGPPGWGGTYSRPAPAGAPSTYNTADNTEAAIQAGTESANSMNAEEERRGRAGENTVWKAAQDANKPTMTSEAINMAFGRSSDQAGHEFLNRLSSIRDFLGGSGTTGGGLAAGLTTGAELGRIGMMNNAKRDLFLEKAKTDAADRLANFQRQSVLADVMMRPVAAERQDWLTSVLETRLGQQGIQAQLVASKNAAKAQEKAGEQSMIGGILGGIFSLAGAL